MYFSFIGVLVYGKEGGLETSHYLKRYGAVYRNREVNKRLFTNLSEKIRIWQLEEVRCLSIFTKGEKNELNPNFRFVLIYENGSIYKNRFF